MAGEGKPPLESKKQIIRKPTAEAAAERAAAEAEEEVTLPE